MASGNQATGASQGLTSRRVHRRALLCAAGLLAVPVSSLAEHRWTPYANVPPLYLEGEVVALSWSEPHPHLQLVQRVGARIPEDLRRRTLSPHRGRDMNALLEQALIVLPATSDRRWRVELPELHRLLAWGMERPKNGYVVGVVGLPGPAVSATPTVQAEIVFMGVTGYPLRAERL